MELVRVLVEEIYSDVVGVTLDNQRIRVKMYLNIISQVGEIQLGPAKHLLSGIIERREESNV
jgi:hypothetical protein